MKAKSLIYEGYFSARQIITPHTIDTRTLRLQGWAPTNEIHQLLGWAHSMMRVWVNGYGDKIAIGDTEEGE